MAWLQTCQGLDLPGTAHQRPGGPLLRAHLAGCKRLKHNMCAASASPSMVPSTCACSSQVFQAPQP